MEVFSSSPNRSLPVVSYFCAILSLGPFVSRHGQVKRCQSVVFSASSCNLWENSVTKRFFTFFPLQTYVDTVEKSRENLLSKWISSWEVGHKNMVMLMHQLVTVQLLKSYFESSPKPWISTCFAVFQILFWIIPQAILNHVPFFTQVLQVLLLSRNKPWRGPKGVPSLVRLKCDL